MSVTDYLRFVLALGFVLGLVAVFAMLLRRYGPGAGLAISRGKGPRRLSVIEVLGLDARRRLVLVRRDGVEHLLLLGVDKDVVVESGIPAPPDTAPEPSSRDGGGSFQRVLARAVQQDKAAGASPPAEDRVT